MNRIALAGLCKIELPSETIRLCDGGRLVWDAETYIAKHATFGTIGSVKSLREGFGAELPPLEMTLNPPSTSAAAALVSPDMQGSRVRFWLAEFDVNTAAVTGTPTLKFDGELDQASLSLQLELTIIVVAAAARLFEINIGNSLSPAFHKTVWPGETGHDNATGLGLAVAWGTEAPPRPSTTGSGGQQPGYFGIPF